jgi:hypothetical protein
MFVIQASARDTILANIPKGGAGAQIGVWKGDFSVEILRNVRPTLLHLIDPWKCADDDVHLNAFYGAKNMTQETMDEARKGVFMRVEQGIKAGIVKIHPAPSAEVLQTFPDASLDFIYVDGDHTYESCLADLRASLRVVKKGGLICGNDYALGRWWGDGVVRALHTFAKDSSVIIELVLGSQYAVRKIS